MEEKGFWLCEMGHETDVSHGNGPGCTLRGNPAKFIKRSEMTGQENRFCLGIIVLVSEKQFKCPVQHCGREAKYIRYLGEQYWVPIEMRNEDLRRKPPLPLLRRNFLVECSEHGEKIVDILGHHITRIPKPPRRRK